MPTLLEIRNDPNYINANAATKQAIFDKYSAGDKDYTAANEATRNAIQQRFGLSLAEEPEPKEEPGFGKMMGSAVKRGAMQTGSLLADVLPAMGANIVGADDYAKKQMEEAAATQQEIQEKYPARYPTLDAVKGVGDYIPFALETGAEQVSSLAPALIPGVGGGMLAARGLTGAAALAAKKAGQIGGAFLGSYALNAPEVFQNIHEETGQFAPGASIIAGGVAAALDSIFPAFILNKFTPGMKMGVVEKLLEKSGMQPGMIRSGLAGLGMGIATEGPTEGAQEAISIMAEKFVGDNKDVWGSKEWNRIIESSVRGAVGGGGISGTLGTISGIGAKGREEARNEKELEEQEPRVYTGQEELFTPEDAPISQKVRTEPPLKVTPEEKVEAVQELAELRSVYDPMQREFERLEKEWSTNPDEQRKAAIVAEATKLRPGLETLSQEIKGLKSKIGSEGGRPKYVEGQEELFEEATPEAQAIPALKTPAPGQQELFTPEDAPISQKVRTEPPLKVTPEEKVEAVQEGGRPTTPTNQGTLFTPTGKVSKAAQVPVTPEVPVTPASETLVTPERIEGLGIKKNTPIAKRIINKDLNNPEDRAFVATQLLTHAANNKVTPEIKTNIKNFLAGVQNGSLRNETRDETSTEINPGTSDGSVSTFEESQDKVGESPVEEAIVQRVVDDQKDIRVSNVGKETTLPALKKVVKPVVKPVVTEAEFRAQSAKLRAQNIKERQEKEKREAKKRALEIKKEAIKAKREAKKRALKAKDIKLITDRKKEEDLIIEAAANNDSNGWKDLIIEEAAKKDSYRTAPKGTKGISVDEVKKAVDAKTTKWVNAPETNVVQSISGLPAHVQARLDKGVTPKGIFDPKTNRVYLIADNITDSRDATITVAHEALGHYGIRAVLGNKYTGMMNHFYNTNEAVRKAADVKIKEGLSKNIAVEEVLADMQGEKAVESIWQQLKNIVRQFLQRLGITNPTDKEVNELLSMAKDFVVKGVGKGRGRQVEGNEVLASAKVDRLKATGSSAAWIGFSEASRGINFANIKTLEQAEEAAEKHYKEQLKNIPEFDGKAYMEGLTINDINAYPPEIQDAIQTYKDGNKAEGIQEILNTVASQRRENIRKWKQYLENINPEMAKDPFWRDYVITSFLKSMRTDKPDTGLPLNANALGQTYEKFKQGENIKFEKWYQYALVDATNDLVELGDETTGWRKIPQTNKNNPKFDERVAAVQSLSCIGWCTRNTMAAPFLQRGDFWVYVDDKKPQVAIRFEGDKVHEIQGPQNTRAIPTKYIKEITNLVDSGKIKNMTEQTKGDIARAVEKSQFEARIKEKLASGELVEKDRAFAKKNGINIAEEAKVYVDVDGWITVDGYVDINKGVYAPKLATVSGDIDIYEGASAPALTTVGGYADIHEGVSAPALTTVGGDAYIREGVYAPKLATVSGDIDIYEGASAPALATVGGDAHIGGSAPALTTVGGNVTIYGFFRKASAPNITKKSIGKEAALKGTPLDPNKQAGNKENELLYSKKKVEEVEEVKDDIPLEEAKPLATKTKVENTYVFGTDASMFKKIEDNKYIPESIKGTLYRMAVNIRHYLIKASYASAFGHDLVDMINIVMPEGDAKVAVNEYFKILREKEATRIDHESKIEDIAGRAIAVKDLNALNAYLMESTKNQKWGFSGGDIRTHEKGKSWLEDVKEENLDKDIKEMFIKLSPESQQIAIDIFKHGREHRQNLRKLIDAEITAYETKGTGKPISSSFTNISDVDINGPYAPISRFGPYVTIGKSKEWIEHEKNDDTDDREWLKKNRGEEKHYYVEFSDSLGTAKYLAKKLETRKEKPYYKAEGYAKEVYAKGITSAPWSEFYKLKGLVDNEESFGDGILNEKEAKKAKTHIQQLLVDLYLTSLAENAARKHELKRDYVAGASPNMLRAFVSKGKADAHFIASLKNNNKLTDLISTMRGAVKQEGGDTNDKIRALNEIITRHALGMDYQPTPIQDSLMQFNSIWTLLTKPAYFFQNLTQPWMMSIPLMGSRKGVGEIKAMNALMKAYGQIAPAFGKEGFIRGFIAGKFDIDELPIEPHEKDMLKELRKQGILDVGISRDLGYWESRGGLAGPVVEGVHKLTSWVRQVESINRVTTALASYRLAGGKPKGIDPVAYIKAVEEATYIINTTHGNYSSDNAPRLWSKVGAGKVILQFRKFQVIQASLMIRLAHNSKYGSPEEKAVARRALKWTLAHYGVMTGLQGLPAMSLIGYLLAEAFGDDDEPADFERQFTELVGNKDISDILLKGVPTLAGLDLTGMLGAQNMLSILPYTDVNLDERGGFETVVVGLMGSLAGTSKKLVDGANMISDGDYYKGLEKMLPSGFSKAAQSYRLATEGLTNSKGDLLMDSEEFTGLVILAQSLGFRTMKVADIQTRTGNLIDFNAYYKKRTSDIKHRYTEAFKEGDSADEMKRLREEYRELQASKRLNGFKPQNMFTLTRAPMEQRKRERETYKGVQTNKGNRRFVRDDAEDNNEDDEDEE